MTSMYRRKMGKRSGLIETIRRKWRKDMTFYYFWLRMRLSRKDAMHYAERTLP